MINKINKTNPDFIITGGDLIMDGLATSFDRVDTLYYLYEKFTKKIKFPIYNTIGNRDIFGWDDTTGKAIKEPLYGKNFYLMKIGKTFYSFDFKGWHFIIFDSISKKKNGKYCGYIDSVQIIWLKNDLKKVDKGTPIVVVSHIPFISAMSQLYYNSLKANQDYWVIANGKEVIDIFENYNLKLVLQGHLHYLEDIFVPRKIHFINWWSRFQVNGLEGNYLGVKPEGFYPKGEPFNWGIKL